MTDVEQEIPDAEAFGPPRNQGDPDVLLDVPQLRVDEISLEVQDLKARVSLQASVLDLLNLRVGVDAELGRVELTIKGVEAQVLLKVHLDNVARILDRVLTTIDNNPQIVERLVEQVGGAVEGVGTGAGEALGDLGASAGSAVEEIGEGAGTAVKDVGRGAGGALEDVGEGVETVAGDLDEDAPAAQPADEDTEEEARPRRRTQREKEQRPRRRRTASSENRPQKRSAGSRDRGREKS
jgi:uncharacterized protein involved in outer membrane biogenesis